MMSNVKKKDVPLISISLVAILFIAFCYAYVRFRRTGIGFAGNGTGDLFSHQ